MHTYRFCFYHIYIKLFGTFLFVPFSLFLLLVALWHLGTFFVLGHLLLLLLLTLLHLMSGSMMIKPVRTFRRTFHDTVFIRNAKSFYWIFPILTFPLSSTVGVKSHCVASRSLVLSWSYRSFTPTCTDSTFCTSVYHLHSRYAHCSHSESYIRGATYTEDRVCWLHRLWAS